MGIWKPTSAECRAIRKYAEYAAGSGRVRIELGQRVNLEDASRDVNVNMWLVTDKPDWSDTDLHDHRDWETFRRGVELTDDGRAMIDMYVSSTGHYGQLETNIQVYFEAGRIVRMSQTGGPDATADELPTYTNDVTTLRKQMSRWL